MCITLSASDYDADELSTFLGEATMMRDFHHPNVLGLVGVVLDGAEPLVVLPHMENGDLKQYISNEANVRRCMNIIYI